MRADTICLPVQLDGLVDWFARACLRTRSLMPRQPTMRAITNRSEQMLAICKRKKSGSQRDGTVMSEGRVRRTTPETMWVVESAREEAAAETGATAAEVAAALWAVPDPEAVAEGVNVAEPR